MNENSPKALLWLRIQDSNLECLIQSQVCYRYTIPQRFAGQYSRRGPPFQARRPAASATDACPPEAGTLMDTDPRWTEGRTRIAQMNADDGKPEAAAWKLGTGDRRFRQSYHLVLTLLMTSWVRFAAGPVRGGPSFDPP